MLTRIALLALLSLPLVAQDVNQPLYVVTHVDIMGPTLAVEAAKMLSEFAMESRKEAGSVRFEVYREVGRVNHFTVVEVWQNRAAFEKHLAGTNSKSFRAKVQPMLGSPFDERLHNLLP